METTEEKALHAASLYIAETTGECPHSIFAVEPHDEPCADACDKFTNAMHLCWKRHFLNTAKKNNL